MARTNTNTGGGGGAGTVTSVQGVNSVVATPNPIVGAGTVQLQNDQASPGNLQYYGTDNTGTKGFYSLSGALFISDTYANISTLITGDDIIPGAWYKITDRADLGIILQGIDKDSVSLHGEGGFLNADWRDAGDYSGVIGLTGIAAGTRQGVWGPNNETTYVQGDICIWNGYHYQLVDAGAINGTAPIVNFTAYTFLPKNASGGTYGYIEEWDYVEFDFSRDHLQTRKDKRSNVYTQDYASALAIGNAFLLMRWGDDRTTGNTVINSIFNCKNMALGSSIQNNHLQDGASWSTAISESAFNCNGNIIGLSVAVTWDEGINFNYNNLQRGTSITLTAGFGAGSGSFESNTISESTILAIWGASSGFGIISSNLIENFSILDYQPLYSSGAGVIQFNTLNQTALQAYSITDTLEFQYNDMYHANVNLSGAGIRIRYNIVRGDYGASNLQLQQTANGTFIENNIFNSFVTVVDDDVTMQKCTFMGGITWTLSAAAGSSFISCTFNSPNTYTTDNQLYNFTGKILQPGYSNFNWQFDITGATTLDLANWTWIGVAELGSSNATESLSTLTNVQDTHPILFTVRGAPDVTFVSVAPGAAVADEIVLPGGTNLVVVGRADVDDTLTLERNYNGIIRYVADSIL